MALLGWFYGLVSRRTELRSVVLLLLRFVGFRVRVRVSFINVVRIELCHLQCPVICLLRNVLPQTTNKSTIIKTIYILIHVTYLLLWCIDFGAMSQKRKKWLRFVLVMSTVQEVSQRILIFSNCILLHYCQQVFCHLFSNNWLSLDQFQS